MSNASQGTTGNTAAGSPRSPVNTPELDPAAEAERHGRITQLRADSENAVETLVLALGDRSWRVRKAAVGVLAERFADDPRMVPALVAGLAAEENAGLRNACAQGLLVYGDGAVAELSQAMRDADLDLRKFAVEVLGAIGTEAARASLLAALDEQDSNVRSAVVDALGRLGDDQVAVALRERLRAPGLEVQDTVYVLDALGSCSAKLPYEELEPWLEHRSLLRFVFPLLAVCGDLRAGEPLVAGVVGKSRGTRALACEALARLLRTVRSREESDQIIHALAAQPGVTKTLLSVLRASDDAASEAALSLLGAIGGPELAPELVSATVSRPFVQTTIEVITAMGPPAVGPLLDVLENVNVEARILLVDIIESIGDEAAVDRLIDVAQTMDPSTADAAVRALGKLGGPSAVAPLMDLVRREERGLSRQAAFSIGSIGRRKTDEVARQVRGALEHGDVRPAWLVVLGALGREADMELLTAASRHQNAEVRAAAVEAVMSFGTRVPEHVVIAAFADEHAPVRVAAASALSAYRTETVLDVLLQGLNDRDPWVVAEVVKALGGMGLGNPKAVSALKTAATNTSAPIAIAALQSLFRVNPAGMESEVRKALQHGDPEVAREGINLTLRLERDRATALLSEALVHQAWDVRWAAAELIATRGLDVPLELAQDRLEHETEDVVREALRRLLRKLGSTR